MNELADELAKRIEAVTNSKTRLGYSDLGLKLLAQLVFANAEGILAVLRGPGAEVERLKAWVADLQSGLYVNCVYCGHRYGPGETTPVSMADALKQHIAQCPEHPMAACVKALTAASHALKSYAHGNGSPDLARDTAAFVDEAIKAAGGKV